MANLLPQADSFMDRLRVGVSSRVDLTELSTWIIKNTRHPKDDTLPWSFKHHENQIAIVNDDVRKLSVRKCSQVGMSELAVRLTLALLGTLRNHTAIYTLPTSGFASKFAKSRFDPVIAASEVLTDLVNKDVDGSELKQIGSNFLYLAGTFTQKAAISVPADILITDEVDFSDQQTLTTYSSRLGHAEEGGIRREFSTPTVSGFGISSSFDISSQHYYGVICDHCHQTVFPDFLGNVIIPGFDDDLEKFEREDLQDARYDINKAYLSCPECHGELTVANLGDPAKRRWVAKFPDREDHGYQIYPYDVVAVNPVPKTLKQLGDYDRKADWVNFKVGVPYQDAESSFVLEAIKNSICLDMVLPAEGAANGTVMGVDVGKVSWAVIGKRDGRKMKVLRLERIRQDSDGALLDRLNKLMLYYGVTKAVIDAGPDFTTSMAFVGSHMMGRVYACYYTRAQKKNTLSHVDTNDEEGIVNAVRTETIDRLVKAMNSGRYELPRSPETKIMEAHLGAFRRIQTENSTGDTIARWVATGPDHYGHALNYLSIADTLTGDRFRASTVHGVLPLPTAVRTKMPEPSVRM